MLLVSLFYLSSSLSSFPLLRQQLSPLRRYQPSYVTATIPMASLSHHCISLPSLLLPTPHNVIVALVSLGEISPIIYCLASKELLRAALPYINFKGVESENNSVGLLYFGLFMI